MPLMKHSGEPFDSADDRITVSPCHPRLSLDASENNNRKSRKLFNFSKYSCCAEPDSIDAYSRVLFPLTFLVFNVLYWSIYQTISNNEARERQLGQEL